MNDSISVSSSLFSNNSSNNSKSNSLNRSVITNHLNINDSGISNEQCNDSINSSLTSEKTQKRLIKANSLIDSYFEMSRKGYTQRRRAKSQILFDGDDLNSIVDQNKLLIEDVYHLKKQLKDKDTKINNLNDIRDRLESEIHELSASLFEQAYTMVNTAKAETAQAEKLLKEANGKIDVLQAEVKALKEVVITSTTTLPNKHLHPYFNTTINKHSRQSSLNQQSLNQIAKATVNSKHDELNAVSNSCSNSSLNSSGLNPMQKSDKVGIASSRSEVNFANSNMLRTEKHVKTHKRGSSHNEIQLQQSKSFMDKFFNSSEAKSQTIELNHNEISKSQQSLQINEPECNAEVRRAL